jgi:hypothetical protein
MPVPHLKSNLSASYALEFNHFAISADRSRYTILEEESLAKCLVPEVNYCPVNAAVLPTNVHKTCTLALFLNQKDKTKQHCIVSIAVNEKLPIARALSNGRWVLSLKEPLLFLEVCPKTNTKRNILIKPPIAEIKVNQGCSAVFPQMRLPIYAKFQSKHRREEFDKLPDLVNYSNLALWEPDKGNIKLKTADYQLPTILKPATKLSDNKWLQGLADHDPRENFTVPWYSYIPTVLFVVVLIGIIIYYIL